MYRNSLETVAIWVVLFAVFGPLLATSITGSLDQVILEMTPYIGVLGGAVLVVLALRMFLR